MTQLILIDNDALLKLARYGLLHDSIALFGCTPANVAALPAAKYKLLPDEDRLRYCEDEESAVRLEEFLKIATRLNPREADLDLLDELNTIQHIDTESLLFAVGATDKDSLVITGDKRSLAALCSDDSVAHVFTALAGRVVTMEVLFLHLIEHNFAHIQKCVRSKRNVDKALSIAFGVTIPADLTSVKEGLTSYIRHLQNVTGVLLYAPFT